MKHALLVALALALALALAPVSCGGAEPGAAVSGQPPATVELGRPAPAPPAEEKRADDAPAAKDAAGQGVLVLLDAGAPGTDATTAKSNLWGDDLGESFGYGGLGLSGSGRGEGIGLAGTGTLGHGAGTGTGQGFGSGGGAHIKPPKVRMGATQVTGRLPPEVVQRLVRQSFGRFRLCYEAGLRGNADLEGKVAVKFTIEKDGAVGAVSDGGSTLPDKNVTACIQRAFRALTFPEPEGGGQVVVVYPILFSPGERAQPPAPAPKP